MKTILISEGDPTSINYELLASTFPLLKRLGKHHRIFLVRGDHNQTFSGFGRVESIPKIPGLFCLEHSLKGKFQLGKPSLASGAMAYASLVSAMEWQKELKADLITLPLSKEWVKKSGVDGFRGHTETLADFFQTKTFMMMSGSHYKVIPLTTHTPISSVPTELSQFPWWDLAKAIKMSKFLKRPKILLLGLNPHAGEGGQIGDEEITILRKGMEILKKERLAVDGPFPADSAFLPGAKKYDLYLACYHDQGLIPFKMLEGKKGVNVTLGLPFLRVSPDHGTAFGIAGKKKADNTGFVSCLKMVVNDSE
ncbi:4-hydroxythreonine-4-phosphate dehydrogenase PdxA [Leptospira sp. 96542]|nr:4-hydroxythreonine-4-phosphate dehydrogenase PdxA [Leptospira sp. 96542]